MNRKQAAMRVIKQALLENDAIRLADEMESELSFYDDMDDFYDAYANDVIYVDDYDDYHNTGDDSDYDPYEYMDYGYSDFALAEDWE